MSIRFLADADLNQAIMIGVLGQEAALDFLSASRGAGLEMRCDSVGQAGRFAVEWR